MTATESTMPSLPHREVGLYEQLEMKEKELEDLNQNVHQAQEEQRELKASNASIYSKLEELTRQMEQMRRAQTKKKTKPQDTTSKSKKSQKPPESPIKPFQTTPQSTDNKPSKSSHNETVAKAPNTTEVESSPVKPTKSATESVSDSKQSQALHASTNATEKIIDVAPKSKPRAMAAGTDSSAKKEREGAKTGSEKAKAKVDHGANLSEREMTKTPKQSQKTRSSPDEWVDNYIMKDHMTSGTLPKENINHDTTKQTSATAKGSSQSQEPDGKAGRSGRNIEMDEGALWTSEQPTVIPSHSSQKVSTPATTKQTDVKDKKQDKDISKVDPGGNKQQKEKARDGKKQAEKQLQQEVDNTKPAEHYRQVVEQSKHSKSSQEPYPQHNSYQWEENSKLVSVMHTNEEPHPLMYLFKFHASVSQSTIDGRKNPSRACAMISMLFAREFINDPTEFPTQGQIKTVPDKVFGQVEEAIREGNSSHEAFCGGQLSDLGPDEVVQLGLEKVFDTDVDTRELNQLAKEIMKVGPKECIMFIKNSRVVSLVPCNNDTRLLLFDSHPHYVMKDPVKKMYGAYLFYVKKEEQVVRDLFMYYDMFCDPKPFFAKLVIFKCA